MEPACPCAVRCAWTDRSQPAASPAPTAWHAASRAHFRLFWDRSYNADAASSLCSPPTTTAWELLSGNFILLCNSVSNSHNHSQKFNPDKQLEPYYQGFYPPVAAHPAWSNQSIPPYPVHPQQGLPAIASTGGPQPQQTHTAPAIPHYQYRHMTNSGYITQIVTRRFHTHARVLFLFRSSLYT